MNNEKVVLGFLAGLATGAVLGILFAPEKGSTTRRKIVQKSDEYTDELSEKFNQFVDDVSEKFETARKEAARMIDNGKPKAEDVEAEVMASASHNVR
jgi:gas vesicle protein